MITNFIVTAFCACRICCGPHATGLAANGKPPVEGITVAGPRRLPLGTKVRIEGVGDRIVQDRMSRRFPERFDVYFKRHDQAKKFGIKKLRVTIIQ